MQMNIELCHPEAKVPVYATENASACDFFSVESGLVAYSHPTIFRTGVKVEVPENSVLLLFPRSGHGFKFDVRLANCVGVIDSDFRGEIKVKLTADANSSLRVNVGDRIAQGIWMHAPRIEFVLGKLKETARGEGGFGSTGS